MVHGPEAIFHLFTVGLFYMAPIVVKDVDAFFWVCNSVLSWKWLSLTVVCSFTADSKIH